MKTLVIYSEPGGKTLLKEFFELAYGIDWAQKVVMHPDPAYELYKFGSDQYYVCRTLNLPNGNTFNIVFVELLVFGALTKMDIKHIVHEYWHLLPGNATMGYQTKSTTCVHKWATYSGITEMYDYCTKCNTKREDP